MKDCSRISVITNPALREIMLGVMKEKSNGVSKGVGDTLSIW